MHKRHSDCAPGLAVKNSGGCATEGECQSKSSTRRTEERRDSHRCGVSGYGEAEELEPWAQGEVRTGD